MNDTVLKVLINMKNFQDDLFKQNIIYGEEIERLKAEIKELNDDNVWWTNRFNAIKKEHIDTITRNEEYRARIDKAIEYINGEMSHHTSNGRLTRKELIKILQGSDKE